MKKVIATIMAAGLVAQVASAVSANVDYVSSYVFRGATLSADPALQPSIEGEVCGVAVGTWGSFNSDTSTFDEIDLYASVGLPSLIEGVDLSIGLTEYTYSGAFAGLESDTEIALSASTEAYGHELGVTYADYVDGFDATYVEFGVSGGYDLSESVSAEYGYTLGHWDVEGVESGLAYHAVSFGVSTALNDSTSIGASFTVLENADIEDFVDEDSVFVVSIGGSY